MSPVGLIALIAGAVLLAALFLGPLRGWQRELRREEAELLRRTAAARARRLDPDHGDDGAAARRRSGVSFLTAIGAGPKLARWALLEHRGRRRRSCRRT